MEGGRGGANRKGGVGGGGGGGQDHESNLTIQELVTSAQENMLQNALCVQIVKCGTHAQSQMHALTYTWQ